jgi:hypothetical protein
MKAEDLVRLTMQRLMNIDALVIDEHLKRFRKNFKRFPGVIDSLGQEVIDKQGNPVSQKEVLQSLDDLADNKRNLASEIIEVVSWYVLNWASLFLKEIGTQTKFAQNSFSAYQAEKIRKDSNMEELFRHIHHFLIHSANVGKLLDKLLSPPNSIRAYIIESVLQLKNINSGSLRGLRNHLEHFDERLDAWSYLYFGMPVFDMNVIDNSTKGLPTERCLRLLNVNKDIFFILGEEYDLLEIYDKVSKVAHRVKKANRDIWANTLVQPTG